MCHTRASAWSRWREFLRLSRPRCAFRKGAIRSLPLVHVCEQRRGLRAARDQRRPRSAGRAPSPRTRASSWTCARTTGGNDPFVFVSWFARKAWGHEKVHLAVSSDFTEDEVRSFVWGDDKLVAEYQGVAKAGGTELAYSFLCKGNACNRTGPRPSELVTTGPVAVLTGPECTSSCDRRSRRCGRRSTSGGRVVGKQPMHGFTSVRHSYSLTAPDNRDMGRYSIALSWEGFAGKPPLEGRPVALDWGAFPENFSAAKRRVTTQSTAPTSCSSDEAHASVDALREPVTQGHDSWSRLPLFLTSARESSGGATDTSRAVADEIKQHRVPRYR